jgi:RNA polymerase sigma-70 factor (ECF subfamily)
MTLAETDFAALAVEQFDALYGLARRLSGDAGRAEDLVQETYLRALRARESFQLEEFGIRPWLMRILHNLHVTGATRESRQPMAIEEEELERVPGHAAGFQETRSLTKDEMDQELVWAIDALPESYRAVLLLWAVEEKSYAEIAVALSLPPGTVMSRLHRARKRICDQLGRPTLTLKRVS